MNTTQRIIAMLALTVFVWVGVFPPRRAGRWSAPWGDHPAWLFDSGFQVDLYRLLMVWFMLGVVTAVALYALRKRA